MNSCCSSSTTTQRVAAGVPGVERRDGARLPDRPSYGEALGPERRQSVPRSLPGPRLLRFAARRGARPPAVAATSRRSRTCSRTWRPSCCDDLESLVQQSLGALPGRSFRARRLLRARSGERNRRARARSCSRCCRMPLLRARFARARASWRIDGDAPDRAADIPQHRDLPAGSDDALDFVGHGAATRAAPPTGRRWRSCAAIRRAGSAVERRGDAASSARGASASDCGRDHHSPRTSSGWPSSTRCSSATPRTLDHHTYGFSRRAAAEGLLVIDDPDSILKCNNKVYPERAPRRGTACRRRRR